MKIWIIFVSAYSIGVACAADKQNITKRGVNDQINYYTDPSQIRYVHAPLANPPQPHFYHNEEPAAVQLYEYQPHHDHIQAPTTHYHNQQHTNIATPIQHGAVIHHGQGYSKYVYPYPAVPAPAPAPHAASHAAPPLYTYANGKILYHPPRPVAYPHHPAPAVTQKPFKPSPLIYYQTPKPIIRAHNAKEETGERKPAHIREDDEESEQEHYDEDEDEFKPSGRYSDDDDEDDNGHYRVQDEDDDRSYSRDVRKSRFKDGKFTKKPKSHYKSYKYSSTKPKKETYESRQTQNIPIVHKHNSFHQEKWFVTKKDS